MPVSGVDPATAIDGMGKAAAGSFAAPEEDASLSALVAGREVDGGGAIAIVAVAVVVATTVAVVATSASAHETAATAAGVISPVDAIREHR